MKLNSINHTFNQSSLKQNRQAQNTSFGALYFKNLKVQQKAMQSEKFTELLKNPHIQEVMDKYNLFVEDISVFGNTLFRACKDIAQKGNNIEPVGFRGPLLKQSKMTKQLEDLSSEYKLLPDDYYYTIACNHDYFNLWVGFRRYIKPLRDFLSGAMENENIYNKLYFKNGKVKENFLDSLYAPVIYQDKAVKEVVNKGNNIIVTNAKNKRVNFVASTDIMQTPNSVVPANNMTFEHTLNTTLLKKNSRSLQWLFSVNETGNNFDNSTLIDQLRRLQAHNKNS